MREHVGTHILKELVEGRIDGVARADTCGLCGLSGRCNTGLRKGNRSGTCIMVSTCTYAPRRGKMCTKPGDVNIPVAHAGKVSGRLPCSNIPMKCELCVGNGNHNTVWKYNTPIFYAWRTDGCWARSRTASQWGMPSGLPFSAL